jgi:hypothetical protein
MAGMKKRTAVAVTVGVWVAGLGSAAALTYDLNRPLYYPLTTISRPAVPALDARSATVIEPVQELQSVLYVPTVTIVATIPRPAAVRRATQAVDISSMHCSEWRDLDMGSGRVQTCE